LKAIKTVTRLKVQSVLALLRKFRRSALRNERFSSLTTSPISRSFYESDSSRMSYFLSYTSGKALTTRVRFGWLISFPRTFNGHLASAFFSTTC
jgi:hypothetical protein